MKTRSFTYFVIEYKDSGVRSVKSATELAITESIVNLLPGALAKIIADENYKIIARNTFEIPEVVSLSGFEQVEGLREAEDYLGSAQEVLKAINDAIARKKLTEVRTMLRRDYVDNHNAKLPY